MQEQHQRGLSALRSEVNQGTSSGPGEMCHKGKIPFIPLGRTRKATTYRESKRERWWWEDRQAAKQTDTLL